MPNEQTSQHLHDELAKVEGDAATESPEAEALPDAPEADDPAALRAEIAELKDRLLRALAEAENIRKRADRDRRDAELYGITRFARDMLSVHDNFERAMKSVSDEARTAAAAVIAGIELTQKDLVTALGKHGIQKITPARGDRFDPKLHQAMFEAPVPDTKPGEIIEVMSEGFTIGERLLRPAQVGVSSGGPATKKEPEDAASDAVAADGPAAGTSSQDVSGDN